MHSLQLAGVVCGQHLFLSSDGILLYCQAPASKIEQIFGRYFRLSHFGSHSTEHNGERIF